MNDRTFMARESECRVGTRNGCRETQRERETFLGTNSA